MADYLLLMHTTGDRTPQDWDSYLTWLGDQGVLRGGSAIGGGLCLSKSGNAPEVTAQLDGYIKIVADSLEHATAFVAGNPVYEAGGVVEIRELPVKD